MRIAIGFLVLLLTPLFVLSNLATAEENWPQFRGPRADGTSDAKGLPVTWSETENIVWKTPIPGKAWSSPVIWGQQIWMTNATEDGKKLSIICVDKDSGKVLHDRVLFAPAEPQFCHPMNSYASCTPVVEAGRVYAHFGAHGTACLDTKTFKTIWSRDDLPCDHFRGPASSPIVVDNLLMLTFDGYDFQYVAALDKKTGETVWKKDRNIDYGHNDGDAKKGYGTPLIIQVDGRREMISPSAGATISYDPATGKEYWRVRSGGMNASALPLFDGRLLFVNTAAGGFKMFAVRAGGSGDVTNTHIAWKNAKNMPTRPSQLLIDGRLYMVNDAGVVSCLDAATGEALWQKRFEGAYSASPIYADGRIYFFSEKGDLPVIEPGAELKEVAMNHMGDGFMASPAVSGKALYLRSRSHLYRVEKK